MEPRGRTRGRRVYPRRTSHARTRCRAPRAPQGFRVNPPPEVHASAPRPAGASDGPSSSTHTIVNSFAPRPRPRTARRAVGFSISACRSQPKATEVTLPTVLEVRELADAPTQFVARSREEWLARWTVRRCGGREAAGADHRLAARDAGVRRVGTRASGGYSVHIGSHRMRQRRARRPRARRSPCAGSMQMTMLRCRSAASIRALRRRNALRSALRPSTSRSRSTPRGASGNRMRHARSPRALSRPPLISRVSFPAPRRRSARDRARSARVGVVLRETLPRRRSSNPRRGWGDRSSRTRQRQRGQGQDQNGVFMGGSFTASRVSDPALGIDALACTGRAPLASRLQVGIDGRVLLGSSFSRIDRG